MNIKPLVWSVQFKPTEVIRYDHQIAETPFGRFLLTWKSWKSEPWQDMGVGFDETPWNDVWYEGWRTPEEAMEAAQVELERRVREMLT